MSEKKELNGWHGALFATVAIGVLAGAAGAMGAFKQDPVKVEEARAEAKRVDELRDGVLIGKSEGQSIERFYDPEARMVCYVLGKHRGISCGNPDSVGISNLAKGQK